MPIQTTSGPSILTDDTLDECSMKRNGKPCGSSNVVPVLHAGMIGQPHGGNPYRRYCLDCEKMGHAISKKAFKRHTHPKVLPRDAEDTDPDSLIPLEDWDRAERMEKVVERIKAYREANKFECPNCAEQQLGKPDECSECGVSYQWDTQE